MMRIPLSRVVRELRGVRRFKRLPAAVRSIVFYAEDAASRVHFDPILEHLTGSLGREICYLTSSSSDPILATENDRIHALYIGRRAARTWLFMDLEAEVMVMTLPDLETFQLKRSRVHPVHYVYVFHSMVSTHMIYRRGAFDHFDTILAAGPHHVREIRATEGLYDLPVKNLVEHGYGRLDSILARNARRATAGNGVGSRPRVLVAPSWSPQGLLETHSAELIETLLAAGYRVTVRPHPMTAKKWPEVLRELESYRGRAGYTLETDIASEESLLRSDVLISDWSGTALEYAFGLERPVLFVDVPRKVRNSEYQRIAIEPLEVSIRGEIGEIVSPDDLGRVSASIDRLCAHPERFRRRIRWLRERMIFNVGRSGEVGAEAIAQMADRRAAGESVAQSPNSPLL